MHERTSAFAELGNILLDALSDHPRTAHAKSLAALIPAQQAHNRWFTPASVRMVLEETGKMVARDKMEKWTSSYNLPATDREPSAVALVMAGNVPLVGFHDLMTVLVSGNRALVKPSSKDPELVRRLSEILTYINPSFSEYISFTEGHLADFDAVIATGSDNSSRYFEYYFGSKPHIFRKNRTSLAIIDNTTTSSEISALGRDIFSYFGLGCRNVSKIFIPRGFELSDLTRGWKTYSHLGDHPSWKNNYNHNRAICLVNGEKFIDGDFFLLKEDENLISPLTVVHYQQYESPGEIENLISPYKEKIQCITGKGHLPFGTAQQPDLWDYADNIDTMKFLLSLKK
ncbi:MAG: acyl-CoA reductase [Bacteroidales bacterium]